jgi:DDE superfamily endonuclease
MKRPWGSYPRCALPGLCGASRPRCPSAAATTNGCFLARLGVGNGRRLLLRRARACAADFQAFLRHLRQRHYRAGQPLWLLLDRASCHVAASSLALAAELDITLLWLPRQCSELNAMDHLWRHLKADLAANRQRPDIDALAEQAEAWTLALSPQQSLRKAGLLSKGCWLKNVRTNFCLGT